MYAIATYFCSPKEIIEYEKASGALQDKCGSSEDQRNLYSLACYAYLQIFRKIEGDVLAMGRDVKNIIGSEMKDAHNKILKEMMSMGYPVPDN